jgi:hypothetical protein
MEITSTMIHSASTSKLSAMPRITKTSSTAKLTGIGGDGYPEGMYIIIITIIIQGLIRAYLLSYEDSKRGEMSLLSNTETTHNNYAAGGRKDNTKTAQKHKA